jgi:hypothetical protein
MPKTTEIAEKIARSELEDLIERLNKGPAGWTRHGIHPRLVALLTVWRDWIDVCQVHLHRWAEEGMNPESPSLPGTLRVPAGCPTLDEIQERCRVFFGLDPAGRRTNPGIIYSVPGRQRWLLWDFACYEFVHLVMNPLCERFAGPCRRCGAFFLKHTRQKHYCSRKCTQTAAAYAGTKRRREQEQELKVSRALQAKLAWERKGRKGDWRSWVIKSEPDITKTWLTRAIKRETITPPDPR